MTNFLTKNSNVKTICHLFSQRRHSQNRNVENTLLIESFMVLS